MGAGVIPDLEQHGEERMPMYSLWRESDNKTFDPVEARNDRHAIAIFSQQLGVELTLNEGPAGPPYMMGRLGKAVAWMKPQDIPVWVKEPDSSN